MTAYYNETEPVACAALRELIAIGSTAEEEAMTGSGSW